IQERRIAHRAGSMASPRRNKMATDMTPRTLRVFVVVSLIFGILGFAFYWWVPMGIVLSISALVFGFVDWTAARRRSLACRLSILAMLFTVTALSIDIVIAVLGLQTLTFGGR